METWGVISDTHGLLRPEAVEKLAGVSRILHAGDVGDARILDELQTIAPVTAVRGNVDHHDRVAELPLHEAIEFGEHLIYLTHIREEIDLDPEVAGMSMVIFGHTHSPVIEARGKVTWFNPGSIGPRRFQLPVSLGLLTLQDDGSLAPELIELDV
ncbi:MAG: metallophosphoesterase family protein [Planctomycetaceae bacterium]|nr:metallophosphoesterase family protein [Planctomycetaceae bacterium]